MGLLSWFTWLEPTRTALTHPTIPLHIRLRLLAFQPLLFTINFMKWAPYALSKAYTVHYIPTRDGHLLRALIFLPPAQPSISTSPPSEGQRTKTLRPLHLNLHGGAFIGGTPDASAPFCAQLAQKTGTVVIAADYRFAPTHPFPTAIDDVDDVVLWLSTHAEELWSADITRFTVSGFSAGGNLALALGQRHDVAHLKVRASVTFYGAIDLRLPPCEKPKPEGFPKRDPAAVFLPLFDVYAGPARGEHGGDARLSPVLRDVEGLPEDMLLVVPMMDILPHEQLTFVERVRGELEEKGSDRRVETLIFDGQVHGWLELPSLFIDETTREKAFKAACDFIKWSNEKHQSS